MNAFKLKWYFIFMAVLGGRVVATPGWAQQLVANGDFEKGSYIGVDSRRQHERYNHSNGVFLCSFRGHTGRNWDRRRRSALLSQNLATTNGQKYVLSLWLNSMSPSPANEFTVSWNGTLLFDGVNLPDIGWTNLVFTNLATSSSTPMQLAFDNDPDYFGLDDVSVTPVGPPPPPPPTPPTNDNIANALIITTPFYQIATTNVGATREANEPDNGAPSQ